VATGRMRHRAEKILRPRPCARDHMTLRLHDYSASGNCYKVRLLLAQLGRPYERVPVDIFAGDTLTDDFARLNPARTTPVLEEDGAEPLSESNAILVHLAEGTELLPDDPHRRAQAMRWLFFEQAQILPGIAGLRFRLQTGRLAPGSRTAEFLRGLGLNCLRLLDDRLADRAFLAGEQYTIADIAVYAYVHTVGEVGFDLGEHPRVREWIDRIEGTAGYMNDLEPYPDNAQLGAGRSIYG
jgi:glutathione S-transferase